MIEDPKIADERARGRFMVISILRLTGVAFVLVALLVLNDRTPLPHIAGWVMLGIGLATIFLAPQHLARAWRTPRP